MSNIPNAIEPSLPPEAQDMEAQLAEVAGQWIGALDGQGLSGAYARALWLYDRLIANVAPGEADSAYAALVEGSASAVGYARAYEVLMTAAGIECVTLSGGANTWNLAKLDGAWTHIDAYMDDAAQSFGLHFALTDGAMARDHSWDGSGMPACSDATNHYFVREKGYIPFDGTDALRALLSACLLYTSRCV